MYVCMYVCMYVYIYIYTHTYTGSLPPRPAADGLLHGGWLVAVHVPMFSLCYLLLFVDLFLTSDCLAF